MNIENDEIIDFIEQLKTWHEHHVTQLKQIVENVDCDIKVGEDVIGASSETANGIRFGVNLSLHYLGKLPFSVNDVDDK